MNGAAQAAPEMPKNLSDWVAPDCRGLNFFDIDQSLQSLLMLYMDDDIRAHMTPHYHHAGEVAGNRLDELARQADRHAPSLHVRDHTGRDEDWIEFHPAYREMEQIIFGDFGVHAMSRRAGVLGWQEKVPPIAKYTFQYLFTQSEFGLMCPVSATDTSAMLIERYADERTKARLLPGMLSQDMGTIIKGAQFMTEKPGGSDVSNIQLEARFEQGEWRLYGEKWFCSCADGDIALLLARPQGALEGNQGLALFAMPRRLDDGARNRYRIVRLKEKLGTRSMASGEIIFDGAVAWPLGAVGEGANNGLKQMMDQVNMSRLSHGVRAAGMMRRCLNEAMVVAQNRVAFGERIIDKPLLRRQLMKLMIPTEQVLSMVMFAADCLRRADDGDERAARLTRILTPLIKFRACRDNIKVATGAMEVRGGNGFIEDWGNAKLVRDAHTGVLWEGTSNINALDVTNRAIARVGAHVELQDTLREKLDDAADLPGQYRSELRRTTDRAFAFADQIAAAGNEPVARQAANALYHITSAVLMASEGARLGRLGGDARRLVMSRMVVDHRLTPHDPLRTGSDESLQIALLLSESPTNLQQAIALCSG